MVYSSKEVKKMAIGKLQNERNFIAFLILVCVTVLVISGSFLFVSIKRDEMGGSLICAMLLFISGYGLIVFIARAVRYKFVAKLQKAVIVDGVQEIKQLSTDLGKGEDDIVKELNFLLNNGYLDGYALVGGRVVNKEAEEIRLEMLKATHLEKQEELRRAQKETQGTKPVSPKKKRIESEKCPNCGAIVKFNNGSAVCPYCGNSLKQE